MKSMNSLVRFVPCMIVDAAVANHSVKQGSIRKVVVLSEAVNLLRVENLAVEW